MKLSTEYTNKQYIIKNKGRVIARCTTYTEYCEAEQRLNTLAVQLAMPELFCACLDICQEGTGQ